MTEIYVLITSCSDSAVVIELRNTTLLSFDEGEEAVTPAFCVVVGDCRWFLICRPASVGQFDMS